MLARRRPCSRSFVASRRKHPPMSESLPSSCSRGAGRLHNPDPYARPAFLRPPRNWRPAVPLAETPAGPLAVCTVSVLRSRIYHALWEGVVIGRIIRRSPREGREAETCVYHRSRSDESLTWFSFSSRGLQRYAQGRSVHPGSQDYHAYVFGRTQGLLSLTIFCSAGILARVSREFSMLKMSLGADLPPP